MSRSYWFVRTSVVSAGLALASSLLASTAQAQGITFTPFVGSFFAASKFIDSDIGGGQQLTAEQTNTAAFGARLSFPMGGTLSVEGSVSFSKSDVFLKIHDTSGNSFDQSTSFSGNVLFGSGRLLYRPRRSNLFLLAGATVAHHGGKAWDDSTTSKLTDVGGVVGFGLRASVSAKFPLTLTAEANLYSFDPDGSGSVFKSKTQADLLFTVGVPISLTH